MTPYELAFSIYDWSVAEAIREGDWYFAMIECVHILALTAVFGTIAAVDLRLLGVTGRKTPVTVYCANILPITWKAFAIAAISGLLLFTSSAPKYVTNFYFRTKMILLVLAGLNMLYFHVVTWQKIGQWDAQVPTPRAVKVAGALSLLFWIGIVFCGRWNGFTLGPLPHRP